MLIKSVKVPDPKRAWRKIGSQITSVGCVLERKPGVIMVQQCWGHDMADFVVIVAVIFLLFLIKVIKWNPFRFYVIFLLYYFISALLFYGVKRCAVLG